MKVALPDGEGFSDISLEDDGFSSSSCDTLSPYSTPSGSPCISRSPSFSTSPFSHTLGLLSPRSDSPLVKRKLDFESPCLFTNYALSPKELKDILAEYDRLKANAQKKAHPLWKLKEAIMAPIVGSAKKTSMQELREAFERSKSDEKRFQYMAAGLSNPTWLEDEDFVRAVKTTGGRAKEFLETWEGLGRQIQKTDQICPLDKVEGYVYLLRRLVQGTKIINGAYECAWAKVAVHIAAHEATHLYDFYLEKFPKIQNVGMDVCRSMVHIYTFLMHKYRDIETQRKCLQGLHNVLEHLGRTDSQSLGKQDFKKDCIQGLHIILDNPESTASDLEMCVELIFFLDICAGDVEALQWAQRVFFERINNAEGQCNRCVLLEERILFILSRGSLKDEYDSLEFRRAFLGVIRQFIDPPNKDPELFCEYVVQLFTYHKEQDPHLCLEVVNLCIIAQSYCKEVYTKQEQHMLAIDSFLLCAKALLPEFEPTEEGEQLKQEFYCKKAQVLQGALRLKGIEEKNLQELRILAQKWEVKGDTDFDSLTRRHLLGAHVIMAEDPETKPDIKKQYLTEIDKRFDKAVNAPLEKIASQRKATMEELVKKEAIVTDIVTYFKRFSSCFLKLPNGKCAVYCENVVDAYARIIELERPGPPVVCQRATEGLKTFAQNICEWKNQSLKITVFRVYIKMILTSAFPIQTRRECLRTLFSISSEMGEWKDSFLEYIASNAFDHSAEEALSDMVKCMVDEEEDFRMEFFEVINEMTKTARWDKMDSDIALLIKFLLK